MVRQTYLSQKNYALDLPSATGDVVMAAPACTTPITVNYVYFVYDRTLYRRTLKTVPTPCWMRWRLYISKEPAMLFH